MTSRPLLIIVNGLPGSGKTTLAQRLAADLGLPIFSRDGLFETLYDALDDPTEQQPATLGAAAFALLYSSAGTLLAAGQPVIVEGFFGRPELRSAEFLQLRQTHDFEPFQIVCRAEGHVLLARMLARRIAGTRHSGHRDTEWLEQNEARLLRGELAPLALPGQVVAVDTTVPERMDYPSLLRRIQAAL